MANPVGPKPTFLEHVLKPMEAPKDKRAQVFALLILTAGAAYVVALIASKVKASKQPPLEEQAKRVQTKGQEVLKTIEPMLDTVPSKAVLKYVDGRIDMQDAMQQIQSAKEPEKIAKELFSQISDPAVAKEIVIAMLKEEVNSYSGQEQALLRLNPPAIKAVGAFVQVYLATENEKELRALIELIPQKLSFLEIDSEGNKKLMGPDELEKATLQVIEKLNIIVNQNTPALMAFKEICVQLRDDVNEKYPGQGEMQAMNLLILRFINPLILQPQQYGLDAHGDIRKGNALYVNKVIQNKANNVAFGKKEAHMVPMNAALEHLEESWKQLHINMGIVPKQ